MTLAVDGLGGLGVLVADDGLLGDGSRGLGADLGRLGLVGLVEEVLQSKGAGRADGSAGGKGRGIQAGGKTRWGGTDLNGVHF